MMRPWTASRWYYVPCWCGEVIIVPMPANVGCSHFNGCFDAFVCDRSDWWYSGPHHTVAVDFNWSCRYLTSTAKRWLMYSPLQPIWGTDSHSHSQWASPSLAAYKLAARITDDMGVFNPLKVLCILGKVTPFAWNSNRPPERTRRDFTKATVSEC